MKVWLDRDTCDSNLAACEACFGQFVRTGAPDRACIMDYEEDGSDTLTVFLKMEGQTATLVIPPELREEISYEGWTHYIPFTPAFSRS
jgi:hypothetical protein